MYIRRVENTPIQPATCLSPNSVNLIKLVYHELGLFKGTFIRLFTIFVTCTLLNSANFEKPSMYSVINFSWKVVIPIHRQ